MSVSKGGGDPAPYICRCYIRRKHSLCSVVLANGLSRMGRQDSGVVFRCERRGSFCCRPLLIEADIIIQSLNSAGAERTAAACPQSSLRNVACISAWASDAENRSQQPTHNPMIFRGCCAGELQRAEVLLGERQTGSEPNRPSWAVCSAEALA